MSILTRTTALIGAGALLAVPAVVLVSSPAQADIERNGSCGKGVYEFNVDRERGGFEVDADLENVAPGSKWRVTLKHDGKRFYRNVLRADNEGELDVDRFRSNSAGKDVFKFRAKRVGGTATCDAKITVR